MASKTKHIRWKATVIYRSDAGSVDVEHHIHELTDLDVFVEAGPHWDTIEKIEIVRVNHSDSASLTIEQASQI